ncbi:MAG: putative YD repeat protein [SAR86 cluster bacterium SAR86B]|uniref:Putative YD repeat protein n=1 Tax=SAR86 cluster bacterium SAR86B TaxID=1123867 RepID=J4WWF9_9GAMM|nr:MAG: putative YD repeat protein [SAR86 cluster bacterium SAR86B]
MKSLVKFSFLLPLLLIYSCGGGGGSSDSNNGSGNGNTTNLPVINSFSSDQTSVVVGNSITLSWTTSYATTCVASGSWGGARATNGSETLIMSNRGTFEYFLVCTNSSGSSGQKSVSIELHLIFSTGDPYDETASYCRAQKYGLLLLES